MYLLNILDKNILDLESIENSEKYFKELFNINDADMDKKNILSEIKCLNFENVNDKFQIIEQNTISIVISTPESMKIIDTIRDGGIVGVNINRKLSPYTISIYDTDVSNFSVDSNTVPNINIWTGNYNFVYGIELDVDK